MFRNTLHVQHNIPQLWTNMDMAGINWETYMQVHCQFTVYYFRQIAKGYAQKASITQNMCSGALMEVYSSPDYIFMFWKEMVILSKIMAVVWDQ